MSIATITVTPTLAREDGTVMALADLASITGSLRVKGSPEFAPIATLPAGATVKFVIPDISPGDYEFISTETDTQVPAKTSAPSLVKAFNVPVPVVILAAPSAPSVGDVAVS